MIEKIHPKNLKESSVLPKTSPQMYPTNNEPEVMKYCE